jgi:hypothetical protein
VLLAYLQLHKVHQAYITSSKLLHSPEVVQAQLAVPLLHPQQCLESAIRRLHMKKQTTRARQTLVQPKHLRTLNSWMVF